MEKNGLNVDGTGGQLDLRENRCVAWSALKKPYGRFRDDGHFTWRSQLPPYDPNAITQMSARSSGSDSTSSSQEQ